MIRDLFGKLIEVNPKMEGQQLFALIGPDPVKVKQYRKNNEAKAKAEEEHDASGAEEADTEED